MKVAILGAGSVGLAYAAFLYQAGHAPVLWSPSGKGVEPFRQGAKLTAEGAVQIRFAPAIATTPDFIGEAEAVIVTAPAYAYQAIFDAVLPRVGAGSTFIISAQLSLAVAYVARHLSGTDVPVMAWGTTVLLGRKTGPASVEIGGIRKEIDVAGLPPELAPRGAAACAALFGERFRLCPSVMTVQLGNLNPPIHLANALCNFTRIERGEAWSNYGGITPSVARLIGVLDRERLAVAEACRVAVRSVERHYHLTFGFEPGQDLATMAAEVHRGRHGSPPGPTSLDTRFVTEDIPFGIVPLMRIAKHVGVPVPVHEAGVALFSALYARDFANENKLMTHEDLATVL